MAFSNAWEVFDLVIVDWGLKVSILVDWMIGNWDCRPLAGGQGLGRGHRLVFYIGFRYKL